MKVLGIIPARGGSKGVKRKNILRIDGKPLLLYTVELAQKSELLAELVVSTEDEEIAMIAEAAGCKVMLRPHQLAGDSSSVVDTALDILHRLESKQRFFDAVLLLQPTAPLRTVRDIETVITMLPEKSSINGIVSVVQVDNEHPAKMYRLEDGKMISEMPSLESLHRQDLPARFIRNGCIYLVRTDTLKQEKSFMPKEKLPYVMKQEWAVNVDSERDVLLLQGLIQKWKRIHD